MFALFAVAPQYLKGLVARFCMLALLLSGTVLPVMAEEVRVSTVLDGDTLRLTDGRIVRLAGIDTPELAYSPSKEEKGKRSKRGSAAEEKEQYYAKQAQESLQKLVKQGPLSLRIVNHNAKDRHERVLAEVLLPDGQSVNEMMLTQGAALAYWHKDLQRAFWTRMLQAQRKALQEQRGMWKVMLNNDHGKASYVGNQRSRRFFPLDCPQASRIHQRNAVAFHSLEQALEEGFAPARICVFWPSSI